LKRQKSCSTSALNHLSCGAPKKRTQELPEKTIIVQEAATIRQNIAELYGISAPDHG